MVGGDGTDASVGEGFAEGFPVGRGFDGRIALDAGAKRLVVGIRKEQMGHASLGCYPVTTRFEEPQFLCRGDMGYMQACPLLPRKLDG